MRFFLFALCLIGVSVQAQDVRFAREAIDTLCSDAMHGRGYYDKGDRKAADYLRYKYRQFGLKTFGSSYFQDFTLDVNTFPGEVSVSVGNQELKPGADYICMPYSGSGKGTFDVVRFDLDILSNPKKLAKFKKQNLKGKFLLIDSKGAKDKDQRKFFESLAFDPFGASGVVILELKKLTFGASTEAADYPVVRILKSSWPGKAKSITVNIETKHIKGYESQNVIGFIPGTARPDSFLIFCGHYDHLGRMGHATSFPGANDNASGTAMILDIARYYAKHPHRYSIAIMAFAGEEAGLHGSKFYSENPLFPMSQIRFVLNLDLMGNGEKGITVVNGKYHKEAYDRLVALNDEYNWLVEIKPRGRAANSDHHWFTEKGVPAFFIYTRGDNKAYHDIDDHAGNIGLYEYEDLVNMLLKYAEGL